MKKPGHETEQHENRVASGLLKCWRFCGGIDQFMDLYRQVEVHGPMKKDAKQRGCQYPQLA